MESWTVNFLISWHVLMLVGRLDQREYAEKKGDFKNREELARGRDKALRVGLVVTNQLYLAICFGTWARKIFCTRIQRCC